MRSERSRSLHRRDVGGDQHRSPQCERAHHQRDPDAQRQPHVSRHRAQPRLDATRLPRDDHRRDSPHERFGERGAQTSSTDAHAEAIDEGEIQHEVERSGTDKQVERGLGVRHPSERARRRKHHEHAGDTGEGPTQVLHRLPLHFALRSQGCCQPRCEGEGKSRDHDAECEGQPHRLHTEFCGATLIPGSDLAGHRRGRAVCEENHDAGHRREDDGTDAQPRQRQGSEPADDPRVRQRHQRLSDESGEGRNGEREDSAGQGHPASLWADSRGAEPRRAQAPATYAPTSTHLLQVLR